MLPCCQAANASARVWPTLRSLQSVNLYLAFCCHVACCTLLPYHKFLPKKTRLCFPITLLGSCFEKCLVPIWISYFCCSLSWSHEEYSVFISAKVPLAATAADQICAHVLKWDFTPFANFSFLSTIWLSSSFHLYLLASRKYLPYWRTTNFRSKLWL